MWGQYISALGQTIGRIESMQLSYYTSCYKFHYPFTYKEFRDVFIYCEVCIVTVLPPHSQLNDPVLFL